MAWCGVLDSDRRSARTKALRFTTQNTIHMGMVSTGERIKVARENRGLTQRQLAERMGLSEDFGFLQVSNWENNWKVPNSTNLVRLADALKVSVDYLLRTESEE